MIDTIIIDRGHGLLNSKGEYVTPGKRATLPDGRKVYEGLENQKYCIALTKYARLAGLNVVYTVFDLGFEDVPLYNRVLRANTSAHRKSSIFVSVHNNAANGKAEGTEVFTSVGQTLSDIFAENIIDSIQEAFPDRKMRKDYGDGDSDKEAQFYVLKHTKMPAVLIEYGFFDTPNDYDWLSNPEVIDKAAKATIEGIVKTIINLYGREAWELREI